MAITPTTTLTIDPGTAATQVVYTKRLRPFSAGYVVRSLGTAATAVFGFNHPGSLPGKKLTRAKSYGASGNTYTVGTGSTNNFVQISGANAIASGMISTGTVVISGSVALNAVLLVYPEKSPEQATLITRVNNTTGGAGTGAQGWTPLTGLTSLSIVYSPTATGNSGVPAGYVLDLIIPDSTDISTLATIAAASRFYEHAATDFMSVGASSGAGAVTMTRTRQ